MPGSNPSSSIIDDLLLSLTGQERLRVWSVIVTFFGDCIVPRGGQVALGSLLEVMSQFHFEGNAVRTALSRLVKDGVLEREKYGRHTSYRLAKEGEALFAQASGTIYANGPARWHGEFDLALVSNGSDVFPTGAELDTYFRTHGFGSPMPGVFMRPTHKANAQTRLDKSGVTLFRATSRGDQPLQALVQSAWPLDDLNSQYRQLLDCFAKLEDHLLDGLSNPMSLCFRILLIHMWRRVVLKDVDLPAEQKADDWQGEIARASVARLYHQTLARSEQALDQLESSPGNGLEAPSIDLKKRFAI